MKHGLIMALHFILGILFLASLCLGSHFRGGIITWTPTGQDLQIELSYRMSWRRSSGHFCNDSTISSGLLNPGEGYLQCTGGCTNTSVPMDYYCTDFSTTEDWTTGTRTLIYNLNPSSTEIYFTFASCCWIDLVTQGSSWVVRAKVNVAKRTDTGKINSSPTTSVSPIVRVPLGCNTTINILVADNDGDIVRCRWPNSTYECGDICLSLPGAVLNEETCTVSYNANRVVGYYGVAVQVEDFASTGVTVPYSSVPVQFLVYVYSTTLGCYSLPEFISPTRGDQEVVYITANNVFVDKIVAISKVPNTGIDEITTVSPSGFIKSALATYPDVPGSWYVNITWTPTASDEDKLHIMCFTATDKEGLTSQQRCINLIVTSVCVNSCSGKSDGNYQHCSDCLKYVACSNGYKYDMPCPANLVWDDRKKQCDYNSSTCSLSSSAKATTSVRTTTPIVQTPTDCVNLCSGKRDGNYQHCSDCLKYVACSNGYKYDMPCPANLVWDDRKKQCDYTSSTCFLSSASKTTTSVRRTTPIVQTPTVCVNSCSGKSDGNYQHCSDCQKYVACSNGYKYDMPCTANLVWDDRKKQCDYNSSTCSSSSSANTTTSVRRTTPIVQTLTVCVNSCRGLSDGDYQNCQGCRSFVSCSNGAMYIMPCSSNLVWDDRKKTCEWVSSTCP